MPKRSKELFYLMTSVIGLLLLLRNNTSAVRMPKRRKELFYLMTSVIGLLLRLRLPESGVADMLMTQ
jgi:hypothetical protein